MFQHLLDNLKKIFTRQYGAVEGAKKALAYYASWLHEHGLVDWLPISLQKPKWHSIRVKSDGHIEYFNAVFCAKPLTLLGDGYVGAYATTSVLDCDFEEIDAEATKRTAEEYMRRSGVIYALHRPVPAGNIVPEYTDRNGHVWRTHFDPIGWFVVSRPSPSFLKLIEDGTLKGYSIGLTDWHYREGTNIVESYHMTDVSYVDNPCNKLSFLEQLKQDSVTEGAGVTAQNRPLKEGNILNESEIEKRKAEMLAKYANKKEDIEKCKTVEELDVLEKSWKAEPEKPVEELTAQEIIDKIHEQEAKKLRGELAKQFRQREEEIKKVQTEDRFEKMLKTLGELSAKVDGVVKDFAGMQTRMTKMEELPAIKGGAPTGTTEAPKSLAEQSVEAYEKGGWKAVEELANKKPEVED